MKPNSKIKSVLKNVTRIILLVLCGSVLGINVYLANATTLLGDSLPMPFGYGAAVVLSGSMEPEFSKGDLIIVKQSETYKTKDIVVFQDNGALVVHRIISLDADTIITKGDANNTADKPITASVIKGKVLFSVPFVGNIVNFVKTPVGTILIIAVAIVLIEIPRRNEKKRDDEQREQIIQEIKRLKDQQQN